MNDFYVYIYLDPRYPGRYISQSICFLYKPLYVGKGRKKRMFEHLSPQKLKRTNPLFRNKIRRLQSLSLKPISFKIYKHLDEQQAFDYEKTLIKDLGRSVIGDGILCNITEGGKSADNFTNNPNREFIREKMSAAQKKKYKEHPSKGHSLETREKIRQGHLGKIVSEVTRKKLREINTGKIRSTDSRKKQSESAKITLAHPEIREALNKRAKDNNPNAREYIFVMEGERYTVLGHKKLLELYNEKTGSNKKDSPFFVRCLKDNKIKDCELLEIRQVNTKKEKNCV